MFVVALYLGVLHCATPGRCPSHSAIVRGNSGVRRWTRCGDMSPTGHRSGPARRKGYQVAKEEENRQVTNNHKKNVLCASPEWIANLTARKGTPGATPPTSSAIADAKHRFSAPPPAGSRLIVRQRAAVHRRHLNQKVATASKGQQSVGFRQKLPNSTLNPSNSKVPSKSFQNSIQ